MNNKNNNLKDIKTILNNYAIYDGIKLKKKRSQKHVSNV